MNTIDLICKKRNGQALSKEEIYYLVNGYTDGSIADYQMSAFLMAVYFKGMNLSETVDLTMAMADSGHVLDLSGIEGKKADKHSTGGVGDKTTLVIAPMVAALGVPVVKMAGRGLSHTGGTIDKLESFKGFSADLKIDKFIDHVNKHKLAVVSQTLELAPADKKIYALRDVTGTVDEISLIAASIMSKKIAAGADVIVLDVKTGNGAFMKELEDAKKLARIMVDIGHEAGRIVYAVISDMNQPLGFSIGNSLEVIEAIQTLKGEGPMDLMDASILLASYMLIGTGAAHDEEEARRMLIKTIHDGSALNKLAKMVREQGGDEEAVFNPNMLKKAVMQEEVHIEDEGYITEMNSEEIGRIVMMLGGGRMMKDDVIDLSVGIVLKKKLGDKVETDTPVAVIHANDQKKLNEAKERLIKSIKISKEKILPPKHIYGIMTKDAYLAYYTASPKDFQKILR